MKNLTFSHTLRDYSVSNRSFGKGLCFVYAIVIAVGSSEDIADFDHFPWRKQRQNHLLLSRSSTTLFSQKEEGNVNETEYSTHTLSHLNANISLIISQTKKCFGLKNCLALSFFVSYSFLLIRTNVHFAFVSFYLFCEQPRCRRYTIIFENVNFCLQECKINKFLRRFSFPAWYRKSQNHRGFCVSIAY